MYYYSTNHKSPNVTLQQAVVKGLAPDNGLYMPESINQLPDNFFKQIVSLSLSDIGKQVSSAFFNEDIPEDVLSSITADTLNFEIPLKKIEEKIYVLELFHGPTFAFKDVGARFMARMLSFFIEEKKQHQMNVLVATSGDTGSAVANGFLGVKGVRVFVLYPSKKVSKIQEAQFATLGDNIVSLEIDGTFDDCQALVKMAFLDEELNNNLNLTSANSINVARFLPQSFYYFHAYAQLKRFKDVGEIVFSVPSGNLGNLTAGLFAKRMGLPINRFIAANNRNDVFYKYLKTGKYSPGPSVETIANAMDVGDPSNFKRILDLYNNNHKTICSDISGYTFSDDQIKNSIISVYNNSGYLMDPHGACAYMALKDGLKTNETGVFLATAHPGKFKETIEDCIGSPIQLPAKLVDFMMKDKCSVFLPNDYNSFKKALMNFS